MRGIRNEPHRIETTNTNDMRHAGFSRLWPRAQGLRSRLCLRASQKETVFDSVGKFTARAGCGHAWPPIGEHSFGPRNSSRASKSTAMQRTTNDVRPQCWCCGAISQLKKTSTALFFSIGCKQDQEGIGPRPCLGIVSVRNWYSSAETHLFHRGHMYGLGAAGVRPTAKNVR